MKYCSLYVKQQSINRRYIALSHVIVYVVVLDLSTDLCFLIGIRCFHQIYSLCNQCLSPLTLWVRIPLRRGALDTTLCDKVYQWLATGRWFFPGTPVSTTNKTDRHDITEILLKVALNTIKPNQTNQIYSITSFLFKKNILPVINIFHI